MKQPRKISNSQLTAFKRSPQHWLQYIQQERTRTEPMILGSAFHCLALEKEKFEARYYVFDLSEMPEPEKDFRTNVNREWRDEQIAIAGDKEVINTDQLEVCKNGIQALYKNDEAVKYIQSGIEFESELTWKSNGLEFYGIRDIVGDDFICDLKFVNNADPFVFQKNLLRDGVYRQGGMYLDGELGGKYTGDPHKNVIFIAVESSPPYGVSVHQLDVEVIGFGVNEYRFLARQLKDCLDTDIFPSYDFRSIHGHFEVYLPNYMATE